MTDLAPIFRSDNITGVFLLLSVSLVIATLYILYRNLLVQSLRVERERRTVLEHFRGLLSASRTVNVLLTRSIDELRRQVQNLEKTLTQLVKDSNRQERQLESLAQDVSNLCADLENRSASGSSRGTGGETHTTPPSSGSDRPPSSGERKSSES